MPSCPYRFPNGQGDVAKFLRGEKNSEEWKKEHGSIYRVWSGTTPEIVLTSPKDIKTVFKDSNTHLKAVNNDAGWLMGQLLGQCLGLVSGVEWQRIHSSIAAFFTKAEAVGRAARITCLTKEHFATLHQLGKLDTGILHPVNDLRMLPFWIVADHLYGTLESAQKLELERLIPVREALFARCIQGGITRSSWSQYLPTKTNRSLRDFKRKWQCFNDAVYSTHKADGKSTIITELYQAVQGGRINSENLHQTLDEMLFANLDVTMGAISWNIMFLAAHQDVQDRVRDEVRQAQILQDDRKWTEYLTSSTTLLACSVLESARLKPLAAFTVPQAAPIPQTASGFYIPPRTNLVVDTYAINIGNEYWGHDPDKYRPDRFLSKKTSEMRYHYWRFGFGPRQCLGKYMAEMMIKVLLVHLLKNYKLSLPTKSSWSKNPDTWITHPNTKACCERL